MFIFISINSAVETTCFCYINTGVVSLLRVRHLVFNLSTSFFSFASDAFGTSSTRPLACYELPGDFPAVFSNGLTRTLSRNCIAGLAEKVLENVGSNSLGHLRSHIQHLHKCSRKI